MESMELNFGQLAKIAYFYSKHKRMGFVYADVELVNAEDMALARRHFIGEDEIKSMTLNILVDTGAAMLSINESIQQQLEFPFKEKRKFQMANGHIEEYDVVTQVEVRFQKRSALCNAVVLPGDTEPLLGAIPLEEMDVLIHPRREELIINPDHPYFALLRV